MTTIAWDGKTLAVDKACWKGNEVWSPSDKLFKVDLCGDSVSDLRLSHPKIVWAATGYCHVLPLVLSWMEKGGDRPKIDKDETDASLGLVLEVDTGKIYGLTGLMTLVPYPSGPVAEGGGHEMALGAMLAGASAVQAIEIVASRSGWAAGGVDSFTLETEEDSGVETLTEEGLVDRFRDLLLRHRGTLEGSPIWYDLVALFKPTDEATSEPFYPCVVRYGDHPGKCSALHGEMCNKATVHPFDQDLWDRAQHPARDEESHV